MIIIKRLGISIYPNHSSYEDNINYIRQAHEYGFSKIFMCLLSVEGSKSAILSDFKKTITEAKHLGFEIIVDVSPKTFTALDIDYNDLSFFNDLGADGLRLDLGFTGLEEAKMTHNKFDLKIEINMSNATHYIDNILSYQPNRENLIGSHNFYPQRYTGLSYDFFEECSLKFLKYGLHTSAFITSPESSFGPWPIMEGMPTLEEHRNLSLKTQAKHLFATQLIDDVIISNCFASNEEMSILSNLSKSMITFKIHLSDDVTELEKTILFQEPHFYRGDVSDYVIRSTQSRVKYKEYSFPSHDCNNIQRGDIVIGNDNYGQYKGELQIALKEMQNDGNKNIIARIDDEENILMNYLKPWEMFAFE